MQQTMHGSFREIQRFDQPWLWGLLVLTLLFLVGLFGFGMYQQLILGQPWGDRPMSDSGLILAGCGTLLFCGGMTRLFRALRLITEVRADGIFLHYYPLYRKFIPYQDIRSCATRTYKPLREYGGWGIKFGPGGWAYNVQGKRGVQLVLINGKRILIGSQRPEALEESIKSRGVC